MPLPNQAIALLPERRPGRHPCSAAAHGGFSGFSQSKAQLDGRVGLPAMAAARPPA